MDQTLTPQPPLTPTPSFMTQPTLEQMLNQRVHIGHLASLWNPRFAPYILTKKNDRHIIDLRKTQRCLQEAIQKMQTIVQGGGKILFVGTKKQARTALINAAETLECAHMVERWLGGTLTNFGTIYKSIKKMSKMDDLEHDIAYKNLTKKEQSIIQGKKIKLQTNLAGIQYLRRPPQALFVVDIKKEATAIKEATKMGIPIFAIVDTNTNPERVDYPIPANDDAQDSIKLILEHITQALLPSLEAWKEAKKTAIKAAPSSSQTKKATPAQRSTPQEAKPSPDQAAGEDAPAPAKANTTKAANKAQENAAEPTEAASAAQEAKTSSKKVDTKDATATTKPSTTKAPNKAQENATEPTEDAPAAQEAKPSSKKVATKDATATTKTSTTKAPNKAQENAAEPTESTPAQEDKPSSKKGATKDATATTKASTTKAANKAQENAAEPAEAAPTAQEDKPSSKKGAPKAKKATADKKPQATASESTETTAPQKAKSSSKKTADKDSPAPAKAKKSTTANKTQEAISEPTETTTPPEAKPSPKTPDKAT